MYIKYKDKKKYVNMGNYHKWEISTYFYGIVLFNNWKWWSLSLVFIYAGGVLQEATQGLFRPRNSQVSIWENIEERTESQVDKYLNLVVALK